MLDWPGSGIHFCIRGRVHSVSVTMTIEFYNFVEVQIDDKTMTLGSSRRRLQQRFCLVTHSNHATLEAVEHQIVIRKLSEPTGGRACTIHHLDVEVDLHTAMQIEPGGEPKEVME
eukprot:3542687-Amphidinium_carterae.1